MYADQENSVWTAHPHLLAEKVTYVEFFFFVSPVSKAWF